jgi:hypothetical protein
VENAQSADWIHRRAGDRRRYNARRQRAALVRRRRLARLLRRIRWPGWWRGGLQGRVARRFGVSAATISRDINWLSLHWLAADLPPAWVSPAPADGLHGSFQPNGGQKHAPPAPERSAHRW